MGSLPALRGATSRVTQGHKWRPISQCPPPGRNCRGSNAPDDAGDEPRQNEFPKAHQRMTRGLAFRLLKSRHAIHEVDLMLGIEFGI